MGVRVKIPAQLREVVGGSSELEVEGAITIKDLLDRLATDYPGLTERILDENGEVRRFINIYAGDEDVRFQDGLETSIEEVDTVSILPAVAGG